MKYYLHPLLNHSTVLRLMIFAPYNGHYIHGLQATDNDDPESNNSRVFYSITKIPSQFSKGSLHIDNITGEITMLSNAPDYEYLLTQNIQHGLLQLEVTATDGGVPPRNSTVLVNVTVTDDNDKDPYFTETIYYGRVFENSPEGNVINVHEL